MFKKLILMLALMIAAVLLVPAPAQAGGGTVWSFEGHGSFLEPVFVSGDEVHASTKLLFSEISPKEEGYPWGGGPQNGHSLATLRHESDRSGLQCHPSREMQFGSGR